jgi:hypothetical protein
LILVRVFVGLAHLEIYVTADGLSTCPTAPSCAAKRYKPGVIAPISLPVVAYASFRFLPRYALIRFFDAARTPYPYFRCGHPVGLGCRRRLFCLAALARRCVAR